MKRLIRIKYKIHHLIDLIFYLLFFIGGYLLGQGGETFEKIINWFNIII